MNVFARSFAIVGQALKAAASAVTIRFQQYGQWGATWLSRTRIGIHERVGDGTHNSIVVACRAWVERAWPEAPLVVRTPNADGEWSIAEDHPLAVLLRRPNPYYSGIQLLTATLSDRLLTGNAYWLKRRGGSVGGGRGKVVELWWVPSHMMVPWWPRDDDSVFISEYHYNVNGQVVKYDPADVVHFRRGFDPNNVRVGRNDLKELLGEIFTDEEASSYVAAILANMGVPGVIISPDPAANARGADLDDVKTKFMERFGGDNRGQPLVMKGPTKVEVVSFSPDQMKVRELRRIPEERVTAVLGIPAIVVGLGAGLERSTFANFQEARESAYESHIIPDHRLFDADLETQLVPDFGDPAKLRVGHDYSQVRVLQVDENALHARIREDFSFGLLTLNDALQKIGEEPLTGPEGDVRMIPTAMQLIHPAELLPPAPAPAITTVPAGSTAPAATTRTSPPPVTLDEVTPPGSAGARLALTAGRRARDGKGDGAQTTATLDSIGPPLDLTDADLDARSSVDASDFSDGDAFWKRATDGTGLESLLDAEPDGGGA